MKTRSYPKQLEYLPESESLIKYTKYLGYDNAEFHKEWYRFLQPEDSPDHFSPLKEHPHACKRFVQLWPRGHGKTESTSINYISWLIGNYRNIHINIVSKTASLAESILLALMTRFESDSKYINVFGEVKPSHPVKWTSQQLIVDREDISKNPTLKATGMMGPITGGRSDLIILDDPIDEENVRTELQLEKSSTWLHKVLIPTLYPSGAVVDIGTRWHFNDLHGELLEKWPSNIKPAINPDNTVLWPEYWSLSKLLERQKEIGSIFFNCQYQNQPTGMEGDLLKAEWLHPWTISPIHNEINYCGVDPALGEGDKQAVAVLSLNRNREGNKALLREVWCDRVSFPEFIELIKEKHALYNFAKIYIESNAFQKVLMYVKAFQGLPVVPVNTQRNKELRFTAMTSHFESGRVQINPLLKRSIFFEQWVQFPRGKYDDALDAVDLVVREVIGKRRGFIII